MSGVICVPIEKHSFFCILKIFVKQFLYELFGYHNIHKIYKDM